MEKKVWMQLILSSDCVGKEQMDRAFMWAKVDDVKAIL